MSFAITLSPQHPEARETGGRPAAPPVLDFRSLLEDLAPRPALPAPVATRAVDPPKPPPPREPFEGLKPGDQGEAVARVQRVLSRWNRDLGVEATGRFDRATREALTLYRSIYGSPREAAGGAIDRETAGYLRRMEDGSFWSDPPRKTPAQEMLYHGSRKLGVPWRLGGNGVTSTDCGMLTRHALQASGVNPRASRLADDQYLDAERGGSLTLHRGKPEAGDLVFFQAPTSQSGLAYRGITHVGLYVGEGLMLAASQAAGRVILQQVSDLGPWVAGYGRPAGAMADGRVRAGRSG